MIILYLVIISVRIHSTSIFLQKTLQIIIYILDGDIESEGQVTYSNQQAVEWGSEPIWESQRPLFISPGVFQWLFHWLIAESGSNLQRSRTLPVFEDLKIYFIDSLEKPWCWERLKTGGEWGDRGDELVGWHHQLNGHKFEQTLEIAKDREAWHAAVHGVTKSWTWLSDWITTYIFSTSKSRFQKIMAHLNLHSMLIILT